MRRYAVAHFTLYDHGVINVPDGFLESNIITNQAKIKKLFVSRTRKRCDSKPDLWMNFEKKKKNPHTYRPIGEMEGRVQETNVFLRVAPLL